MKQFIVLMATIVLGVFIYACIAGGKGSVQSEVGALWKKDLAANPYRAGAQNYSGGAF